MSTLSLNRKYWFGAFAGLIASALLPAFSAAAPIDHMTVVFNGGNQNFVAGVTTNTTGSGQIWINAFTVSTSVPHDVGETVTLELLKDGSVVPNAISPSFVTIKDTYTVVYGFPSSSPVPITFFYAGSGLAIRATPSGGGTAGTSATFSVTAGAAAKLIVLAPGEALDPGKDPSTSGYTGKTGTANFQEPNQAFTITVRLTDSSYNPVAANHTITLTSGDQIDLPSGGALTNGVGTYSVTIRDVKAQHTITATDITDPSVTAGSSDISTSGPPAQEVFPFPSPFNPKMGQSATLRYRVSEAKTVTLKIQDQFGQSVWQREISSTPGFNDAHWDGRNDKGSVVASGVYYILLEIDGSLKSKKRIGVVK